MTLRGLEIFSQVAQSGKMSDASHILHISQPTISQCISELEREFKVELFTRLNKRLYITAAGKQLLIHAQAMLAQELDLRRSMQGYSQKQDIAFGATLSVGQCVCAELVKSFEATHKRADLKIIIDNTENIENMLLDSELDLALVEGNIKSKELIAMPVMRDELLLVCSKDYVLAKNSQINVDELSNYSFIMREKGSGTREEFEKILSENNISIDIKWSCRSSDTIIEALLAVQGAAVISERLVKDLILNGSLCAIKIKNIKMIRYFSLVYHKSKAFPIWTRAFVEHVKSYKEQ